jgi:hypothetical protein
MSAKLTDPSELDHLRETYFEGKPTQDPREPEEIAEIANTRNRNKENEAR